MNGDVSRVTSLNAKREGYSRVLMQQGRVQLDADWNEQAELTHHRERLIARDAFGLCGVPAETPDGFRIAAGASPGDFAIGAGRMYVDGLLVENHEPRTYLNQPFFPNPKPLADILKSNEIGLAFLRVFERHVTALEDDRLRERALGGADTATRVQTVGRIEVIPLPADKNPADIRRMVGERQPLDFLAPAPTTRGALEARVRDPVPVEQDRPCLLDPEAGYLGPENQLYRVEVHRGGDRSATTIKWSRENGSVGARLAAAGGNELVFEDDPRVDEADFPTGGWVELITRAGEDAGEPGHLALLQRAAGQRRITLTPAPPQDIDGLVDPRLRRWDQRGPSPRLDNGVPVTDDWINLEDGIQVRFTAGTYRSGQYWSIPARTVTGTIEWPPTRQPGAATTPVHPLGGDIHFCPLALINRDGSPLENGDLRLHFQPLTNLRTPRTTHIITVVPMLLPIELALGNNPTIPNFGRAWFHRLGYAFAPFGRDSEGWMSLQLPHGAQIQAVRFIGRNRSRAKIELTLFRHAIAVEEGQRIVTKTLEQNLVPLPPLDTFDETVTLNPVESIDNNRFRYVFHALVDRPSGGATEPAVWLFALQITYTTN